MNIRTLHCAVEIRFSVDIMWENVQLFVYVYQRLGKNNISKNVLHYRNKSDTI